MSIETLEPIREAASELPEDWLDRVALPPNTPTGMKYSQEWRATPKEVRQGLVAQAADAAALFIIWAWELDAGVRSEIVRSLGDSPDRLSTNAVLKKIFVEETPDAAGQAIRREVKHILRDRAAKEATDERAHGATVRTRGAIRTRGAVRSRGAAALPPVDRSARVALVELEDLEAANPRFTS